MPTVKVARTLLHCPLAFVAMSFNGSVPFNQSIGNRIEDEHGALSTSVSGNCIGEGCAMWRWHKSPVVDEYVLVKIDVVAAITGEEAPDPRKYPMADRYYDAVAQYLAAATKNQEFLANQDAAMAVTGFSRTDEYSVGEDDAWDCVIGHYTRESDSKAIGYCGLAGKEGI